MAYKNPEQQKLAQHQSYLRHRDKYLAQGVVGRQKRARIMQEAKNKPCQDCGRSFPHYVMDFDHREPSDKKFGIASNKGSVSLQTLRDEIAKCDVVCANCHRERSWHSIWKHNIKN